jgi:hypothetical protein
MYPNELHVNYTADQTPLSKQNFREICGTKVRCTGMQVKIINEGRNVDLSGDVMVQQIPMAAADAVSTAFQPGSDPPKDWVTKSLNLDHLYNVKGSCDTELNAQASEGRIFEISTEKEIGAIWAPEGIPKYNKLATQRLYQHTSGDPAVTRDYDLAIWNSFAAQDYYTEKHMVAPQPMKDKQPAVLIRIRNCQTTSMLTTGPSFLLEMTWQWEIISAAPMKMYAAPSSIPWNHSHCQQALNHLRSIELSWQGTSNGQRGHNTRCGLGADYIMPTFPGANSPGASSASLREAIRLKSANGESELIRQMHKVLLEHHDKAVLGKGKDVEKHVHKLHNVIKQMEKHQDTKPIEQAYQRHHGWLHSTKEGRERRRENAKTADELFEEVLPSKGARDFYEVVKPLERTVEAIDAARDFVGA